MSLHTYRESKQREINTNIEIYALIERNKQQERNDKQQRKKNTQFGKRNT